MQQRVDRREPELGGERTGDSIGIADPCQIDEPDPEREPLGGTSRRHTCGSGLADATGPDERHEPTRPQPLVDLVELGGPADQLRRHPHRRHDHVGNDTPCCSPGSTPTAK